MKTVMIVDAQGGGLGKQLIIEIRKEIEGLHIIAVGSNATATAVMLKAGADEAATGENAVKTVCRRADYILGPIGMVIADSMLGEITPKMAEMIASADAIRIMIPFSTCNNFIAGVAEKSTGKLISIAVAQLKKEVSETG